ncbi:hypothetical protein MH117_05785 [Paenibacillus sp. ACRRX]|uniref:hypothetical protein n=1 Tax=Paenibacillus sp. ACRRX TaxID=2918206 RepID=UPI001EF4947A|nr:hypothetical protein [Paenibacillus sp. ACRRX]MCG7406923.1 hypothetical protein [Paenibacillus sp. ACRRX]
MRFMYSCKLVRFVACIVLCAAIVGTMGGCGSAPLTTTPEYRGNPLAALYYSTDLPHEKLGDGLSYVFLIDQQGALLTLPYRGLELNSLIPFESSLLLHQKKQLLAIQDTKSTTSASYEDACKVYAGYGQSSGRINVNNMYYALFNGRFSDDRQHYISTMRWGNESNHYCQDLNDYIEVSGDDGADVYFISSDAGDSSIKSFNKMSIQGERVKSERSFLERSKVDGRFMFTKLIADGPNMLGIYADLLEDKVQLNLMQIDKKNKSAVQKYSLLQYDGSNTHYYFFNKESIYVKGRDVYFVDGYGDVYAYNLTGKRLELKFHLKDYTRESQLQDEMVYFYQDYLYFYRFNSNTSQHQIEQYNLQGDIIKTVNLPDLSKQLGQNTMFLYDFKILNL